MKNKIFVLEDSSKAKFGGGQKITLSVVKLISVYFNIELFDTSNDSIFFYKAQPYCCNSSKLLTFSRIHNGFTGYLYKIVEIFSFIIYAFYNVNIINKRINNDKKIILYATTKKSLVYAFVIHLIYKNEFIYHAHLSEKKFINRLFYRLFLFNAKSVISVSDFINRNISLNNTSIIYNPIALQPDINAKLLSDSYINIVVFASLIKIKGVIYFLESYKHINPKYIKRIKYHIYGSGYEEIFLKKKYENENVLFKGFCNNVIEEMKNTAHILCFPTIINEACPMAILEAFSCGIPVISTNIGGQAELVKDGFNGFLVPIKNSKEIANKINLLVESPELFSYFSKNALKSATNYSYDVFEKETLNVFKNI